MKLYVFTPDEPEVRCFSVMSDSEENAKKAISEYLETYRKATHGNISDEYRIWYDNSYTMDFADINQVIES